MIINWEKLFNEQPGRYTKHRNKKGELIQVDDAETGYTWIKDNGKWRAI